MEPIHNRMPVILDETAIGRWLDPEIKDVGHVQDLLKPAPADVLEAVKVSTYVNNVRNEGPRCVEPVE